MSSTKERAYFEGWWLFAGGADEKCKEVQWESWLARAASPVPISPQVEGATQTAGYLCIITRTVYGFSGTELPPPAVTKCQFVEFSSQGETRKDFEKRMSDLVMPIRLKAEAAPVMDYSARDGWDWWVIDINPLPALRDDNKEAKHG